MNSVSKTRSLIWFGVLFAAVRTLTGPFALVYPMMQGLSVYEVGLSKGLQFLTILLLDFPISYWADRKGYSFSLKYAVFFGGLYFTIMACANHLSILLLAEICNGLSLLLFGGAFQALLFSLCKEEKKSYQIYNGLFVKYSHLAMIVSASIGGLFLTFLQNFSTDWSQKLSWVFLFSSLSFFSIFIFSRYFFHKEKPSSLPESDPFHTEIKTDFFNVVSFIKGRHAFLLALLSFLFSIVFYLIVQIWQPILVKLWGKEISGLWLTLFFLTILFSQYISGAILSRYKLKTIIKMVFSGVILSLLWTIPQSFFPAPWGVLWFLTGVTLLFWIVRLGIEISEIMLLEMYSADLKASLLAVSSTCSRLFLSVMTPLSFWIVDRLGGGLTFFVILLCLSLPILLLLKKNLEPPLNKC